MGQIQRYTFSRCKLHFDPHICLCGKLSHPNGDLVLYADHLAAMAAKDEQIRQLREALQEYRKQCRRQGVVCCGYPDCDGDLIGEAHEPACPRFSEVKDDRCKLCKAADALLEAK